MRDFKTVITNQFDSFLPKCICVMFLEEIKT